MKYFLVTMLLVCMSSRAAETGLGGGLAIGSLEMWSPWFNVDQEVDLDQMCPEVLKAYNEANFSRGYWGYLLYPYPVRSALRRKTDGSRDRKFFCAIRVFKGGIPAPTSN